MSAPIVAYGHWVVVVFNKIGSGLKLMSKGCADMSRIKRFRRSMSIFDVGRM